MMDVISDIQPAVISVKHQDDEDYKKKNAEDLVEFDNSSRSNEVLENLNKLRKNKQFCDVILQVSSKVDVHEVYAHRAVVASVSPYLFELFNQRIKTGNVDRNTADHCALSGEVDIDVFESIIDYAYTSKLEMPKGKIKAVYLTAARLKINPVVQYCGRFLVNNLIAENCLGIRAILLQSMDQQVISQVDGFIKQNINEVLKSKELSSLGHVQVELMQCSWAEMDSTNERHLFQMVLDWLSNSRGAEEKTIDMERLTEKVHLLYLNRDRTLHDCNDIETGDAKDSEIVQDYKRLSKRLSQTNGLPHKTKRTNGSSNVPVKPKQFLYTRSDSSASSSDEEADKDYRIVATTGTGAHSTMGLAIVCGQLMLLSVVQRLNAQNSSSSEHSPTTPSNGHTSPTQHSVTTLAPMAKSKCAMGVAPLNDGLFVCGGYDRGECLKSSELLNLAENRWSSLPDMSSPRGRTNIASLNGLIYAVGGSDGTKDLGTAEVYDPQLEKWSTLPPLSSPRSHAGVCSLNGKIFVIGGWNGQRGMDRVDMFDPVTSSWSQAASLNIGRSQAGVCVMNGFIYALGGCEAWNCTTSVEKYDPEEDKWNLICPLQQSRRGCGAATYNGKIYAIGGHDSSHSLCTVEIYDPTTNAWSSGPSLTTCRANVGATVVQGRLLAVGGFNGKTFLNTLEMLDSAEDDEWTVFVSRGQWTVSNSRESSSGISGC